MDTEAARKPHVVCIPVPTQGHVNPMMQLAKLIHSRGFHITFINTEFNHRLLVKSKGLDWAKGFPDFQFETIPDGLPPSDRYTIQDHPAIIRSIRNNGFAPFRDLLYKLKLSPPVSLPPVTFIIADGGTGFAVRAAEEVGVPAVQFLTASACGFMGLLQYPELIKRGIVPFKDENYISDGSLDMPIDWIPGMKNMRLKDIPTLFRTTDPNDFMFNAVMEEAQNCLRASALIFNTFDALEHEVIEAIKSKFLRNIYTIGPLSLMLSRFAPEENELSSFKSSLWKEDSKCLEWLDQREANSVVYVSFGSQAVMTDQHFKEFAWGLAYSNHPFLWIVSPDTVMGESAILPQGFLQETKDRGLLASWCPQDQVLAHPAVGIFLTHCGWNSTLESISRGVPIVCWPFFAEQQTNCRYACTIWGVGIEVNQDVKRHEIEGLVKEMMEGEKGEQMRKKTLEWKKKAEEATDIGGSSYDNLDRFIKEALHSFS